ncbi:MAG: ABC transporter substrate-binding protein [Firmicutes bacterium]|nr:ABC transporter substrate-binding protein [Bacillota bacterium]
MKKLLAALCLFLLLLCGCSHEEAPETGITTVYLYTANVVKMQAENSVFTIDPAFVSTDNELFLARLIFSGLVKESNDGIIGDLAAKWRLSEDKLTYTFTLKDNLCFSDGTPLTVKDIKFSWERALRITAPNAYLFENIVGADRILAEEARELEGFSILDEKTFSVKLNAPDDAFLHKLCNIGAVVLKESELLEHGTLFAAPSTMKKAYPLPSGTGPYRISEWLEDKQATLTANEHYYDAQPSTRRIEIAFNSTVTDALLKLDWGELDAVQNVLPSQIPYGINAEELAAINYNSHSFMSIIINPDWIDKNEETPLSGRETRLALMQLLDADILNGKVNENSALTQTGMTDYWYTLDTELRKMHDYSQKGDFKLSSKLKELPILCGPTQQEKATALAAAELLQTQGIKCNVFQLDYADLLPYMEQGKDFALLIYEYNDRGSDLHDFFRLFIQANIEHFFPITEGEELTSKQKNTNASHSVYRKLLTDSFNGNTQEEQTGFLKLEQELCRLGYLKTLWFNSDSFTYDPKIRNMNTKLSEILN